MQSGIIFTPKTFTCESNVSNTGFESNLLDTLNNTLITLFAKTLTDFVANRNLENPDFLRDTSWKLVHEVETVLESNQSSTIEYKPSVVRLQYYFCRSFIDLR